MYNLPYHKEQNEQVVKEFIHQHPFAFLTGCDAQRKPVATQVPVFMEERNCRKILSGHIMKNTDHHKAFLQNQDVLTVFTGPHVYVSGTWYNDPRMPSTWNYMSVHVKGKIRFLDDVSLKEALQKTSLHFENNNEHSTTVFNNLHENFKQGVLHAVVAFEIEIEEIDTVFKLSQDRDVRSYHNIIDRLHQQGEGGKMIASEMEKRANELFPDGPKN